MGWQPGIQGGICHPSWPCPLSLTDRWRVGGRGHGSWPRNRQLRQLRLWEEEGREGGGGQRPQTQVLGSFLPFYTLRDLSSFQGRETDRYPWKKDTYDDGYIITCSHLPSNDWELQALTSLWQPPRDPILQGSCLGLHYSLSANLTPIRGPSRVYPANPALFQTEVDPLCKPTGLPSSRPSLKQP